MRCCAARFAKSDPRPSPIAAPVMTELLGRLGAAKQTVLLRDDPADVVQLSSTASVSGRAFFAQVAVTRKSPNVRKLRDVFVVGGAESIRRIWLRYRIRPNCVFVPDTDETPSWCFNEELPTYLVRAPPVKINRSLLSAELNDGFAAEFPCPAMPPLTTLLDCALPPNDAASGAAPSQVGADFTQQSSLQPALQIRNMLVLHKVAMVSNVGGMVRAANAMGFDAVLLDRCTDVFNEKVLRASGGTVVDPKGPRIFQLTQRDVDSNGVDPAAFMQSAAHLHALMPFFAMPAQQAEHVFPAALRFHHNNERRAAAGLPPIGAMLVFGSERAGAAELMAAWAEASPAKTISLQMDNAAVESLNVAVACSIVMHHFRAGAAAEFRDVVRRGVVPEGSNRAEPLDVQQLAAT